MGDALHSFHLIRTEEQRGHKPLQPVPNALNTQSGQKTLEEAQEQWAFTISVMKHNSKRLLQFNSLLYSCCFPTTDTTEANKRKKKEKTLFCYLPSITNQQLSRGLTLTPSLNVDFLFHWYFCLTRLTAYNAIKRYCLPKGASIIFTDLWAVYIYMYNRD